MRLNSHGVSPVQVYDNLGMTSTYNGNLIIDVTLHIGRPTIAAWVVENTSEYRVVHGNKYTWRTLQSRSPIDHTEWIYAEKIKAWFIPSFCGSECCTVKIVVMQILEIFHFLVALKSTSNLKSIALFGNQESSLIKILSHDDVIKWKHFPRNGPLWGKPPVTVGFPSQWPVTRSFDVFIDLNGWANNGEAGDWRRHRAHYDVIVIIF